jgi:hypothetical protein
VRRVAELEHTCLLLELEGEPLGERHTDLADLEWVTTARLSSPGSRELAHRAGREMVIVEPPQPETANPRLTASHKPAVGDTR